MLKNVYYFCLLAFSLIATGCETIDEKVSDVAKVCESVVPVCNEVIEYSRSIER